MTSYSAEQYRAAIEAGLKHRQREESLAHKLRQERALKLRYMAENERLRAENEALRSERATFAHLLPAVPETVTSGSATFPDLASTEDANG
jgi:hypothetical protein